MRYLAKIHTKDPIQAERRFIISYFLSDDSIHVYEPPVKNSGINGGRFLERGKVKRPNQPPYSTKLPEYYDYNDFYVGSVLILNNFYFQLFDADEYCYSFMEKNSSMFPYSNSHSVFAKFKSVANSETLAILHSNFMKHDSFQSGAVKFGSLYSAVKEIAGNLIEKKRV